MLTNTNDHVIGEVVSLTTDNTKGIIISQNQTFFNVLFQDYKVMPILRKNVQFEGKRVNLDKIWETVNKD